MQTKLYLEDFNGTNLNRGGNIKVTCPLCRDNRSNKRDKSLSINCSELTYHCHYCNASGKLRSRSEENKYNENQRYFTKTKPTYIKPQPKTQTKAEHSPEFLSYFSERGIGVKTIKKALISQEVEYFPQLQKRSGCIAFNYYKDKELTNVKYRTRGKDFKLVSGAELILYNIDSIAPNAYKETEEKYAIIVEGEMDCLSYIEAGFDHCVSVPNGANVNLSYLDDYIESHIDHLDYIYISVDNDKKGLELKAELIRRFGVEKCRIVDYPEPCKDANDVLVQLGKDALVACLCSYTEIKPNGIQELSDVEADLDYLFNNGYEKGDLIGVPDFDNILTFKTGLLYTVTGVPSHGKTNFLNYVLCRLNIYNDWKIAFFSPEFYPTHDHIGQIIETMGGRRFGAQNYSKMEYETLKDYVKDNFFWIDPDDTELSSVMERAEYFIKRRGIKALVIDPFNALTDKNRGNNRKDEYISDFLQMLRWFARRNGIALFLVMHPVKQQKLDNGLYPVCDLYSCKGGSEIYDKTDIGITVWRNRDEDYAEVHTTKIKFRHLGKLGYSTFKYNINNARYVPIQSKEECDKAMFSIRDIVPEWDNSNYVTTKINNSQTQSEMSFTPLTPNTEFDVDFSYGGSGYDDDDSCPF